jgi:dTDP-4-dehydrorhamnose reductase
MKILIIGNNGQLGHDLAACARTAGHSVEGIDVPDIDFTDPPKTLAALSLFDPQTIINCSAFTAVDACESNQELAFTVNRDGVALLARFAKERGVPLLHFSTDYVFDGTKATPYVESDRPNPQSVYGKSKLAAEEILRQTWERHIILRIAWLYGCHGTNFVKTILKLGHQKAQTGEPLKVVNDQVGTPTFTMDVCRQVLALMGTANYGLFHSTNEGACSWYDFARLIVGKYGVACTVVPCTTQEFPRPAPRPANSVLENERLKKLGLNLMRPWEEAFEEFAGLEMGTP